MEWNGFVISSTLFIFGLRAIDSICNAKLSYFPLLSCFCPRFPTHLNAPQISNDPIYIPASQTIPRLKVGVAHASIFSPSELSVNYECLKNVTDSSDIIEKTVLSIS